MDTPTSPSALAPTRRPGRRTALGLVLVLFGALLALTGAGPLAGVATAQTANNNPSIASWNAYANYPNTLPAGQALPDGCDADGGLLVGLDFQLNGTSYGSNMRDVPSMVAGDVLGMSWTGWAPGCDVMVTLSIKAASTPVFDPTTDQALVDFAGCSGANDATCIVDGGYHLDLPMPQQLCNYQADAVVGPPLDVVGPAGSFYSNSWRQAAQSPAPAANGPDMLISANNGGPSDCAPPAVADVECDALGASLTITNPDLLNTVRVNVSKDGVSIFDPANTGDIDLLLEVGPNSTSAPVVIPATPADGEFQITVVAAGETIYDEPFTNNCTDVTVGAVADCEAGTIDLTATNGGVQPVVFTATASTPSGGTVPVAIDPVTGLGSVAPSATESTTITFFADGVQVGDPIVIPPCEEAVAAVQAECADGVITVTTTQPTGYDVEFVVTATVDGEDVPVTDNGDGTFTIDADRESADVLVTADGETVFDGTIPGCDDPSVDAVLDCEAGSIVVTTTQPTDHDVVFSVTANGTPVALVGGVATIPSGDQPVAIVVTADGETILEETVQPCDEPEAGVTVQCSAATATVTVVQPTDHDVDFLVTANGTPVAVTPAANGTGTATASLATGAVRIVVTADGETLLDQTVQPCDDPEADATVECSNTTITVTTEQPTDHTVEFLVTANGTPVPLTNGTATTPIGSNAVTIVVTADGTEIHRETIQPCTEVEGVQQTRTPSQLPRTGGEDTGRLLLAIGLVISGLGLVLFGEDRRLALLRN